MFESFFLNFHVQLSVYHKLSAPNFQELCFKTSPSSVAQFVLKLLPFESSAQYVKRAAAKVKGNYKRE